MSAQGVQMKVKTNYYHRDCQRWVRSGVPCIGSNTRQKYIDYEMQA